MTQTNGHPFPLKPPTEMPPRPELTRHLVIEVRDGDVVLKTEEPSAGDLIDACRAQGLVRLPAGGLPYELSERSVAAIDEDEEVHEIDARDTEAPPAPPGQLPSARLQEIASEAYPSMVNWGSVDWPELQAALKVIGRYLDDRLGPAPAPSATPIKP